MNAFRLPAVTVALATCLLAVSVASQVPKELTKEQERDFLLSARVVNFKLSSKGVTHSRRLTLSDGTFTHDASFQTKDDHNLAVKLADGTTEMNFVDSYKYNIAAYIIAEMLGLEDLLPVTVERKWQGEVGSLTWWLPVVMDEAERLKKRIGIPDIDAWNKQVFKIRVLNELFYDTDPNATNLLIGKEWQVWRIDYSRGFRTNQQLRNSNELVKCDRRLLERLKAMDAAELQRRTRRYLTKPEIEAVVARRDLIVAHFKKMIAEKGEAAALY